MYTVYIIENPNGKWYIGVTNNIRRRIQEHQTNQTYTTKRLGGPWQLIYAELCLHENDAKKRERFLKTVHGRHFLKKRLDHYLKEKT